MTNKWKRKLLMYCTLLVILLVGCGENAQTTWQEQYDLGMKYLEDGDYEQAIVAFTAAIKIDPKQTVVYVGRAQAYIGSGETEENLSAALTDYESALALDDMNPDIYLGMADVYIRQGDYEKAKEILNQALEKLGENETISEKINELENGDITDSDGKERRRQGFDESGNLLWYHDLIYDADKKISREIAYTADGIEKGQVEWIYDENEECIQHSGILYPDGDLTLIKCEIDDKGNIKSETDYLLDGTFLSTSTFKYDDQGRVFEKEYNDGTYTKIEKMEYDANGYKIKSSDYQDNKLVSYTIYENDELGNCVRENYYEVQDDGDDIFWGYRIFEHTGDIVIETKYDADGNIEYTTEW